MTYLERCINWTRSCDRDGYGYKWRKGKAHRAHRVVYADHHGLDISQLVGMVILHTCDNPRCVNPSHLRAGTAADNDDDKIAKGRQARGERHGVAKLSEQQVREIRRLRASGETLKSIAGRFGCHLSLVHLIAKRMLWKHVEDAA